MDRSSAASADSTAASTAPDSEPRFSANPTRGDAPSSPQGSPECPSRRRYETYQASTQETNGSGRAAAGMNLLISSAADSHVRTSPSQESAPDSRAPDPGSSTSSCGSQTSLFQQEGMSSLRTYPDSFHLTRDEISPSFSRRWPSSGFWMGPGECWTAVTSECHSEGDGSSSLRDVLEDSVAPRYFLSPRAAAGILRRAEKRGKRLPEHLEAALRTLADGATTPTGARS